MTTNRLCKLLMSLVLMVTLCVAAGAQTIYEKVETKREGPKNTLTFSDQQGTLATIIADNDSGYVHIHTREGKDAWIKFEVLKETGFTTNTVKTSSGRMMKLRLGYPKQGESDKGRPISSIALLNEVNQWEELSKGDLTRISATEKKLFDTPELELLYNLLKSSKQGMRLESNSLGNLSASGENKQVGQDDVSFGVCRATCWPLSVLYPIFSCWDNALPDVCPCPIVRAYLAWDLSCCCRNPLLVCLVPCYIFGGGAIQ